MFTGIIEAVGQVQEITGHGTNKTFWISAPLTSELKVDQSIAHNGVCLTIEEIKAPLYRVTAVKETLDKTNLGSWLVGSYINLERSLLPSSRLDGHFVQGHVDTTGLCKSIKDCNGSYEIEFEFPEEHAPLIIEKGSICINGISLTAFGVQRTTFKVAIIPFTWEHTNLQYLKEGDKVNLEFDMVGKYIIRKQALNIM
ncbi:riboflavin synthase [Chitinophagaceae bacterium LB-8]|uniref:Riboflavin synthase n=1 Tax=Paraflavisolibacter caeni TaxID=2982496 RepID=A0A9X2XVD6_9BACT|nr:riboflavin synthase [Paraflavisolibacter caeni]MCU7550024.1 riboflavin synthase [Paraflavisolibacter caeni]